MGALYQHAGASSIPVEVSARHLRLELTRRLGLPPATPDADVARLAEERLSFDGTGLAKALSLASGTAENRKLRARDALARVQSIERFAAQLEIPKPWVKEKD
jgi:hypothetical protein